MSFDEPCLEAYEELAGTHLQPYRNVDAPAIDEKTAISFIEQDKKGYSRTGGPTRPPWKCYMQHAWGAMTY